MALNRKLATSQVQRTPYDGVRHSIPDLDLGKLVEWPAEQLTPAEWSGLVRSPVSKTQGSAEYLQLGHRQFEVWNEEQPTMKNSAGVSPRVEGNNWPLSGTETAMHSAKKYRIGRFRRGSIAGNGKPSYSAIEINEEKEDESYGNEEKSANNDDRRSPLGAQRAP
ncbi:hypothetical protein B0H19DRAFT_1058681 [Mycena capillaripes]|nr:hypothetical protein B0H19DRAFT_1058681 [Mycena capillaripes]